MGGGPGCLVGGGGSPSESFWGGVSASRGAQGVPYGAAQGGPLRSLCCEGGERGWSVWGGGVTTRGPPRGSVLPWQEVEALLGETRMLQGKLQSQEDDFRLQNSTLLRELAKVTPTPPPRNPLPQIWGGALGVSPFNGGVAVGVPAVCTDRGIGKGESTPEGWGGSGTTAQGSFGYFGTPPG